MGWGWYLNSFVMFRWPLRSIQSFRNLFENPRLVSIWGNSLKIQVNRPDPSFSPPRLQMGKDNGKIFLWTIVFVVYSKNRRLKWNWDYISARLGIVGGGNTFLTFTLISTTHLYHIHSTDTNLVHSDSVRVRHFSAHYKGAARKKGQQSFITELHTFSRQPHKSG